MAELLEMRGVVGDRLERMIKGRINGFVLVEFYDENLSITIIHNGSGWRIWFDDFDKYLINGYSLESVVEIITKEYKKNVMREYFY